MAKTLTIVINRWHHSFDSLQFSSMDFFKTVEESLSKKQMPEVSFKRITLHEKGIFSPKREYLRIMRNEYAYIISAAPFGTDFFVSYWFGEKLGFFKRLILRIPFVALWYIRFLRKKTYFEQDTENMFKGGVHSSFMAAIDIISTAKGIRGLTELERKPIEVRK